jgi:hypothetical protein
MAVLTCRNFDVGPGSMKADWAAAAEVREESVWRAGCAAGVSGLRTRCRGSRLIAVSGLGGCSFQTGEHCRGRGLPCIVVRHGRCDASRCSSASNGAAGRARHVNLSGGFFHLGGGHRHGRPSPSAADLD